MKILFDGSESLIRTLVIGVLAYLTLIAILRFFGKRTLSKWNAFDSIVTIALGSTLATALLSKTTTYAQGITAFTLLVALQFAITWLSVHLHWFRSWINSEPALLLHRGKFLNDAMARERVTESEILAAVRGRGAASLADVEVVVLETDGSFSVIQHKAVGDRAASDLSSLADVQGYPGNDDQSESESESESEKS